MDSILFLPSKRILCCRLYVLHMIALFLSTDLHTYIQQEKKLWESRKESIHSNAETFGKISPLLRWFAHRVSTKIIKDDDEKDSSDEGEEGDIEAPTIGRKQVSIFQYLPFLILSLEVHSNVALV